MLNCFSEPILWSAFCFSTLSFSHFDFWHSTFLDYRKDLFVVCIKVCQCLYINKIFLIKLYKQSIQCVPSTDFLPVNFAFEIHRYFIMHYNWDNKLAAASTSAGSPSRCLETRGLFWDSDEMPFDSCLTSFCTSVNALFTVLTFSSFTMFIFFRLVVTGLALFLAFRDLVLATWKTLFGFDPLALFLPMA